MAVDPASISVGKCYVVLSNGQVRRVLTVDEITVIYESRGKRYKAGSWGQRNRVNKKTFADDVDEEVQCDYDLDIHGGTISSV